MSTDNLDQLTDAELSERVAVKCAGWRRNPSTSRKWFPWLTQDGGFAEDDRGDPIEPAFATDANAVLPLTEAPHIKRFRAFRADDGSWTAIALHRAIANMNFWGTAHAFPRACCLALLRAAEAEKGAA